MKIQTAIVVVMLAAFAVPVAADPLPLAIPEGWGRSKQTI
jgi:hypothetical protein